MDEGYIKATPEFARRMRKVVDEDNRKGPESAQGRTSKHRGPITTFEGILETDLARSSNGGQVPATATLNIYSGSGEDWGPTGETLTVTNRDDCLAADAGDYLVAGKVGEEWRPWNPSCGADGSSGSGSGSGDGDNGNGGGTAGSGDGECCGNRVVPPVDGDCPPGTLKVFLQNLLSLSNAPDGCPTGSGSGSGSGNSNCDCDSSGSGSGAGADCRFQCWELSDDSIGGTGPCGEEGGDCWPPNNRRDDDGIGPGCCGEDAAESFTVTYEYTQRYTPGCGTNDIAKSGSATVSYLGEQGNGTVAWQSEVIAESGTLPGGESYDGVRVTVSLRCGVAVPCGGTPAVYVELRYFSGETSLQAFNIDSAEDFTGFSCETGGTWSDNGSENCCDAIKEGTGSITVS